jgi:phage shock protein A
MGDVGLAIQRAEDKTAQMQARASAVDELIASGALDDVTAIGGHDDISRELESMSSHSEVESELARLKASAHGGAIEGSSSAAELGAAAPAEQPMQAGAESPVQEEGSAQEGRA